MPVSYPLLSLLPIPLQGCDNWVHSTDGAIKVQSDRAHTVKKRQSHDSLLGQSLPIAFGGLAGSPLGSGKDAARFPRLARVDLAWEGFAVHQRMSISYEEELTSSSRHRRDSRPHMTFSGASPRVQART